MNLEKFAKYAGIVLVLLLVPMVVLAADPVNPNTSPTSPVDYSPGGSYQFNITCDNPNGTASAWLSLDGHEYNPMSNEGDEFYITIVDIPAALDHYYSFKCGDDNGNTTTDLFSYVINKATTNVSLTVAPDTSVLNGTQIMVNCNGDNPEGAIVSLTRNGQDVTSENATWVTLNVGTWNYTCESSETKNYTSASQSQDVTVYKNPTSVSLFIDGAELNKSFSLYDVANFTAQANISGVTISMTSNLPGWEELSEDTVIYNETNIAQSGVFWVTVSYPGNETYEASSTTLYFDTVAPQYTIVSPAPSEAYELNKTYWFNVSWDAATLADVWLSLKIGNETDFTNYTSELVNDGNVYSYNIKDSPVEGFVYYWCAERDHTENVTNCTDEIVFNISKATSAAIMTTSGTSITYGTATNFTCVKDKGDYSSPLTFTRNDIPITGSGTIGFITLIDYNPALPEDTYIYRCTIDESQNYTSFLDIRTLIVTPASYDNPPPGDPGVPSETGTFGITASSPKTTIAAGFGGLITFTLTNTLSGYVRDLEITVTGIDSSWYDLDKTTIKSIRFRGGTEKVKMTLNIPADAELNIYSIKFKVTGEEFDGTALSKSSTVVLTVSEAPAEEPGAQGEPEAVATSQTGETIGAEGGEESPTGFALSPDVLPDVILIIGILSIGVIFLFRDNVTKSFYMIGRKRGAVVESLEEKYPEKPVVKKKSKSLTEIKTAWIDRLKQSYGKYNYNVVFNVQKKPDTKEDEENKNV